MRKEVERGAYCFGVLIVDGVVLHGFLYGAITSRFICNRMYRSKCDWILSSPFVENIQSAQRINRGFDAYQFPYGLDINSYPVGAIGLMD
jgi:hypothetical protein